MKNQFAKLYVSILEQDIFCSPIMYRFHLKLQYKCLTSISQSYNQAVMETLSNSEWPTLSPAKGEKACKVPSEKNKKCDVCSYATAKVSNLKKHTKLYSTVKLKHVGPLNCPDCDKSFEIKKKAVPGHVLFICSLQ